MTDKKRIVICGQTATGKTSLAQEIAITLNGEIISADSRQIYTGMDLGTGKIDSSDTLQRKGNQWFLNEIAIHGINIVTADKAYSSGEFAEYGTKAIKAIEEKNKTAIIVGGTGFYIKSLLLPDETISIPLNKHLRKKYDEVEKNFPIENLREQLIEELEKIDPEKLKNMNNSDRNNPRRLVRAIEVAQWNNSQQKRKKTKKSLDDTLWIGLTAPKEFLQKKITKRVGLMIEHGLIEEIKKLLEKYSWDSPGLKTLGYKEWKEYFEGSATMEETKQKIITAHLQYARKQMIYFKRFPFIHWVDISDVSSIL